MKFSELKFLQGTFLVSQAAAKQMMESGNNNGSIVNVSSITAKVNTHSHDS